MRRSGVLITSALAVCCVLAGCATSSGVEIARSNRRQSDRAPETTTPETSQPETTQPDTTAPETTQPDTTTPDTGTVPGDDGLPGIAAVEWQSCPQAPDPWQCATIGVPLDYGAPDGRSIDLALTRLPAGDPARRIGSLVVNPGGPGGSGLEIVYSEASSFPGEILDRFDLVGFDPRGVGSSTSVRCPEDFDPIRDSFQACIDLTGDLLPFLGTPNAARDLEMIRKAIGDELLTYLGYSYGTALGAVYADMFPERIRALVLDGAIDPDAGSANLDEGSGYDFYAEQDFEATLEVFHDLCDATIECVAGTDSHDLLEAVYDTVRETPVAFFGDGSHLNRSDVDDVVYTSMYSSANWPILGIALRDADNGDASTLAAMSSWLQFGYPADMEAEADFEFANVAIRCADFANRGGGSFECADFPDTAEALPVITTIDASAPIVVVGTKSDPATPGRYAAQLAGALGDAVDISWEGAGHTAFLTSSCVTAIVTSYIVDRVVPSDGQSCPFVVGADTLAERADAVFAEPDAVRSVEAIEPVLADRGIAAPLVACVATGIVEHGDERMLVHQLLGVESPELVRLRDTIAMGCIAGR